jgi:hypothetical protein
LEKTSLPLADFNNYNLRAQLGVVSANISKKLGDMLKDLLGKIRKITDSKFSDSIVKTFYIELVCLSSINLFCIVLMFVFLFRINTTLKWCYEGFVFMKPSEIEIQNSLTSHVLNLMSKFKYNETRLVNEFIDQRFSNKKIVSSVEAKARSMNKRSYAEIMQPSLFPNHFRIILRLI